MRCDKCRYWVYNEEATKKSYGRHGECRAALPVIKILEGETLPWGRFPLMAYSAWCGYFSPAADDPITEADI